MHLSDMPKPKKDCLAANNIEKLPNIFKNSLTESEHMDVLMLSLILMTPARVNPWDFSKLFPAFQSITLSDII